MQMFSYSRLLNIIVSSWHAQCTRKQQQCSPKRAQNLPKSQKQTWLKGTPFSNFQFKSFIQCKKFSWLTMNRILWNVDRSPQGPQQEKNRHFEQHSKSNSSINGKTGYFSLYLAITKLYYHEVVGQVSVRREAIRDLNGTTIHVQKWFIWFSFKPSKTQP